MLFIEQVLVGVGLVITFAVGMLLGRMLGIKTGQNLRNTDTFIYKNYPFVKQWKQEKKPDELIIANLLKEGTEKQAQELLKFYDKYQKQKEEREAKHFKEQFKDEPIGKKIVDSLPFKY